MTKIHLPNYVGSGREIMPCNNIDKPLVVYIFSGNFMMTIATFPHSAVGNMSGNRCEFDCRSRGREFDPSPVPYFCGD